jgi:hypothetical protein
MKAASALEKKAESAMQTTNAAKSQLWLPSTLHHLLNPPVGRIDNVTIVNFHAANTALVKIMVALTSLLVKG